MANQIPKYVQLMENKDKLLQAASTLYWTKKDGNKVTLGSIYKRMQDYIQHAWHEDNRAFEVVLQIARDYESDIIWFSKNIEAK